MKKLSMNKLRKLVKESVDPESLSDIMYDMRYNDSYLGDYVDRIDDIRIEINDLVTQLKAMLVNRNPDKDKMFEILSEISEKL